MNPVPQADRGSRASLSAFASLRSLLSSVVVAIFVVTFVAQAFQIPSSSMEKTLLVGDYLLVDKARFGASLGGLLPGRDVERDDIVVFHYPVHPESYFVKRVVAVPGDRVRIVDKQLFVNGRLQADGFTQHIDPRFDGYRDNFPQLHFAPANVEPQWWVKMHQQTRADGELVVPPGQYFVLGDNRDDSQDSRYWGFVPRANIIGSPLVIYWSVRSQGSSSAVSSARGDTLSGLAYAVTHLHQNTRWDRMLRIVR
jgi:signal peptidase I